MDELVGMTWVLSEEPDELSLDALDTEDPDELTLDSLDCDELVVMT